ncbi:hypothetical protein OW763_00370 [Clostridium aestuarii]|uniref:Uncharacterized protein n=1 Tax=Clostridium aestuarii TaxID=338193 RepID=A0ABT4CWT7_9CLOT|nr:hypothetical protein [Clostridium aestuarii]MCY6482812.1 hypothetical protein [Clostridium aestuarii]
MEKENIEITITYNNEEYYKNIFMDYIIDFILKNNKRSCVKEENEERH